MLPNNHCWWVPHVWNPTTYYICSFFGLVFSTMFQLQQLYVSYSFYTIVWVRYPLIGNHYQEHKITWMHILLICSNLLIGSKLKYIVILQQYTNIHWGIISHDYQEIFIWIHLLPETYAYHKNIWIGNLFTNFQMLFVN